MIKYLPKTVLTFFLFTLFTFSVSAVLEMVWEPETVIFSDTTINNVEVVQLSDGRYRMYFHQGLSEIKSAISADGKSFQIESGTRIAGVMPATIKLLDGRWRMYYKTEESGVAVFKSATSNDGLSWTVEPGVRLTSGDQYDPDSITHPNIISLPTGGYRMYYDGEVRRTEQEFTWSILSATSVDGLVWTKDAGVRIDIKESVLDANLAFSPHAVYENGQYSLYFTAEREGALSGIHLANSSDGLNFYIQPEPLLAGPADSSDGAAPSYPQDPFVFEFPQGKRMYYWTAKDGVLSALQVEKDVEKTLPAWRQSIKNVLDKVNLGNINLPSDWQLYIVPGVLLTSAGVIIYLFLKFSRK